MELSVRNFIQNQLLAAEYIELDLGELSSGEVLIGIQRGVIFGVHVIRFEEVAKGLVWDFGKLAVDNIRRFLVFLEIFANEVNALAETGESLDAGSLCLFFPDVEEHEFFGIV